MEPGGAPQSDSGITRGDMKTTSFLGATPAGKMLDAIDQEKQEGNATKPDDAEVPVVLQVEHLINQGNFGRTMANLPMMRPLIAACQFLLLRWWKRKVTTSLVKWSRKKIHI